MTFGSVGSPALTQQVSAGEPADPTAILKPLAVPRAHPGPAVCSYRAHWPPYPGPQRAWSERQRAGSRDHVHLVQRIARRVTAAIRAAGQDPPSGDGGG